MEQLKISEAAFNRGKNIETTASDRHVTIEAILSANHAQSMWLESILIVKSAKTYQFESEDVKKHAKTLTSELVKIRRSCQTICNNLISEYSKRTIKMDKVKALITELNKNLVTGAYIENAILDIARKSEILKETWDASKTEKP